MAHIPQLLVPKKPNDPLEAVSVLTKEKIDDFLTEFSGMSDVYMNEQEDRAIIFAQSKANIKKIFKNFWQEGRFNPIRVKYNDLENPPPISSICSSNINMNQMLGPFGIIQNLKLDGIHYMLKAEKELTVKICSVALDFLKAIFLKNKSIITTYY